MATIMGAFAAALYKLFVVLFAFGVVVFLLVQIHGNKKRQSPEKRSTLREMNSAKWLLLLYWPLERDPIWRGRLLFWAMLLVVAFLGGKGLREDYFQMRYLEHQIQSEEGIPGSEAHVIELGQSLKRVKDADERNVVMLLVFGVGGLVFVRIGAELYE